MHHVSDHFSINIDQIFVDKLKNYKTPGGAIFLNDTSCAISINNSFFVRCSSSHITAFIESNVNGGSIYILSKSASLNKVFVAYSQGTSRGQSIAVISLKNKYIKVNCTCDVGCQTIDGMSNGISALLSTANIYIRNFNTSDNSNYDNGAEAYHIGNYPNSVSNTVAGFSFSNSNGAEVSVLTNQHESK